MTTSASERRPASLEEDRPTLLSRRLLSLPLALLDLIVGIMFALVALSVWIGADYIERNETGLVGPAGFPRGVALIFGALALAMAVRGALGLRLNRRPMVEFAQPLAVLAAMVLAVAYPILLGYFDYYLVTGPWLVALFLVTGNRKPLPILLYAAGFLLFTKLVFEKLMGVPLP